MVIRLKLITTYIDKWDYGQLLGNLLYFSFNFMSFCTSYTEIVVHLVLSQISVHETNVWSGQGKYLPKICWKQHIFTTKVIISWILPKIITNFCDFLGKHMYMYHVYSQNILHIYGTQKSLKDPPKSGLRNNEVACTTVLGACPCMWEIMPVKEQMQMSLIIMWYGGRKCTKLVLKSLAAKNDLSFWVLCTTPFL